MCKELGDVIFYPEIKVYRSLPFKKYLHEVNLKNTVFLTSKDSRTPSKRHLKYLRFHTCLKLNIYLKSKVYFYKKKNGTNYNGQLVSYHKGNGYKILYREIENYRYPYIHVGVLEQFEYSPYNSCLIARFFNYKLNYHFYIRAVDTFKVGDIIGTIKYPTERGDTGNIINIMIGQPIHNINLKGSNNVSRAAGTYAMILQKYTNYSLVRFPSNKLYYIPSNSQATLGKLSNEKYRLTNLGKAGRKRWLGKRPHVRGVAMNPIDHPHGGGEGKTSGGHSTSVSPWGKPTKQIKKKKESYCAKNRRKVCLRKEIQ